MPLYFFDISGGELIVDDVGSELPNLAAARNEAIRYSAEVLSTASERFWNCEMWTMLVQDERRRLLFTLKFLAQNAPSMTLPL